MRKTIWLTLLLVLLLLAAGATVVQAQAAVNGAIRGAVYQDTNADGVCGAGDPALGGVRIDFTLQGGQTMSLLTNNDGTYGLASIALGTWQVTVWPPTGWVPTSPQSLGVFLSSEQPTANVNFCLAQEGGKGGTLPESGLIAPPLFLVAAALSLVLILAGLALIVFSRRGGD